MEQFLYEQGEIDGKAKDGIFELYREFIKQNFKSYRSGNKKCQR